MDLEIILTPGLGNATYLLASDGEAVVVDPPRDAWRVTALADARGWRLTHVVETHVHNGMRSNIGVPTRAMRSKSGASAWSPARHRGTRPSTWRGRSRPMERSGRPLC